MQAAPSEVRFGNQGASRSPEVRLRTMLPLVGGLVTSQTDLGVS